MDNSRDAVYYKLLYQWINVKNDGISLLDYFEKEGYKSCAIYGMGELGRLFARDMKGKDLLKYAIDKNAEGVNARIKTVSLSDTLEKVDVIVVTLPEFYESIKEDLKKYTDIPVVSIEDVLYSL